MQPVRIVRHELIVSMCFFRDGLPTAGARGICADEGRCLRALFHREIARACVELVF